MTTAARFYAKFKALMYAAQSAEDAGEPFGIWLDSLGFIVAPMRLCGATKEDYRGTFSR